MTLLHLFICSVVCKVIHVFLVNCSLLNKLTNIREMYL